jgi:hypothetical protein
MADNLTVSMISGLKPKTTAYYEWDKSGEWAGAIRGES